MQYDINKILDRIETETLGDLINGKKKNKYLSSFNINFFDNLINFTNNKIKSGSCFEICGSTCTGKTELLIHIITKILIDNLEFGKWTITQTSSNLSQKVDEENKNEIFCVLNQKYFVKYKPYCETIYFFDCDGRFNFYRLIQILKFQFLKILLETDDNSNTSNINIKELFNKDSDVYDINIPIRMCLKYFNIIKPTNTFSLIVSLLKLKDLYPTLLYIIIDSISSFYYIDIEEEASRRNITEKKKIDNNILSYSLLYKQLNKILKLLSQKYKITLFLTTRQYKKDYNNENQDITLENVNENLINSLYRSTLFNNNSCTEYYIGLQNNQLIFKNLFSLDHTNSYHQDNSVYQEDLINFKIQISKHPEHLLEIPDEISDSYLSSNNNSKFISCLTFPIKSNILEFEINNYGIV
ncbi:hypothetical protein BCR32DRAFT_297452 [Anaeromyces robustus]|uniref:DNA recombination and repair protein Rad51-like C-terminal domain-containing protein n=1 Tax=Anaeromyces robustus TaxID=1754192 RepID=A0A1Y1W6V3_9FUNG|nr:hypothetical protein BCR32DRAFT_297452 [Anaeromyces robustus]|eukprot:ORX68894.1 hypothetical protein BCR32DRAFT_297452 [Anaeromyces robustus]